MGMFDNISVSDKLPITPEMEELGLDKNLFTYQTKDLECMMDSYFIQGGKLYIKKYKESKWVEGNSTSDNWIEKCGRLERSGEYMEEVNYHGLINFYDYIDDVQDKWDCWVEYQAVFNKGVCESINLCKFTKTDNTQRKHEAEMFRIQGEYIHSLWYNKYIFHTRCWRYIRLYIIKMCESISSLCFKIISNIP